MMDVQEQGFYIFFFLLNNLTKIQMKIFFFKANIHDPSYFQFLKLMDKVEQVLIILTTNYGR